MRGARGRGSARGGEARGRPVRNDPAPPPVRGRAARGRAARVNPARTTPRGHRERGVARRESEAPGEVSPGFGASFRSVYAYIMRGKGPRAAGNSFERGNRRTRRRRWRLSGGSPEAPRALHGRGRGKKAGGKRREVNDPEIKRKGGLNRRAKGGEGGGGYVSGGGLGAPGGVPGSPIPGTLRRAIPRKLGVIAISIACQAPTGPGEGSRGEGPGVPQGHMGQRGRGRAGPCAPRTVRAADMDSKIARVRGVSSGKETAFSRGTRAERGTSGRRMRRAPVRSPGSLAPGTKFPSRPPRASRARGGGPRGDGSPGGQPGHPRWLTFSTRRGGAGGACGGGGRGAHVVQIIQLLVRDAVGPAQGRPRGVVRVLHPSRGVEAAVGPLDARFPVAIPGRSKTR